VGLKPKTFWKKRNDVIFRASVQIRITSDVGSLDQLQRRVVQGRSESSLRWKWS